MSGLLLLLFGLLCAAGVLWGMLRPERVYEYPFLASCVFAAFVLPQLIGVSNDPYYIEHGFSQTAFMSSLCLIMCFIGWYIPRRPSRVLACPLDDHRLLIGAAVLVAGGAYFFMLFNRLPQEMLQNSQMSGRPVMILFFAKMLPYGLALSLYLGLKRRWAGAWMIGGLATLFYLDRIIIGGRRGVALEFVFVCALLACFTRGWRAPRWAVLGVAVLATMGMYSTGQYRATMMENRDTPILERLQESADIPYWENLCGVFETGGPEVQNAVMTVYAHDQSGKYDYGIMHWNTLVFNYVPAQIVGADFKESLTVDRGNLSEWQEGYSAPTGSTNTGVADAFGSFWYFGCLKFFVIAYFMRTFYTSAQKGDALGALLYALVMMPALHCVTHHTQWFFSFFPHFLIFCGPILLWARTHRTARAEEAAIQVAGTGGRSLISR